jgi:hypothetical protein
LKFSADRTIPDKTLYFGPASRYIKTFRLAQGDK